MRHDRIIGILETNPTIRVNSLADKLEVSTETVRRDLAELDESGRLKRTYGGAVRTTTFEPALAERLKLFIEERDRMARHAVALLAGADSLFIGGGATSLHFARVLKSTARALTVLTPSIGVAMELAANPLIRVMSLPGIVEPNEGLMHGAETVKFIAQYRAPYAVVGASAIDEAGVSEALLGSAQVYSAIIAHADETFVLADHSKFGNRSLQLITTWRSGLTLVTDAYPDRNLKGAIIRGGATISVPES
jgi:DeoR/GlpR family transcriptional regulator of sugar metabolism